MPYERSMRRHFLTGRAWLESLGLDRPVFPAPEWENDFLFEHRETGRKWAGFAVIVAAAMYTAFLAVAYFTEPHTVLLLGMRAFIAILLLIIAAILVLCPTYARRHYVWLTGGGSASVMGGVILIFLLPHSDDTAEIFRASPSFVLALVLHYALLRLPLLVAVLIGGSLSVAAWLWVPMITGGSQLLRTAITLVFANMCGLVLTRFVESRERHLFLQRRQAEAARAESRLREMAAEDADRQKTRLIAAVSHDLRQPMVAAMAYLEVMRLRLKSEDAIGARIQAEKAHAAVSVLGTTLDHLLTAARYESGTEPVSLGPVKLLQLMQQLHDSYVDEAERRGLSLRFRIPRRSVHVETDSRSLLRVLGNLLSNAIKFSDRLPPRQGAVLVSARIRGNSCRIDVIDTGRGISPDNADAIWKPYVQLENVERDRARGLGLGLYIVRTIVEQLPGHVLSMASRVGHGSRFSVTVPLAEGVAAVHTSPLTEMKLVELPLTELRGAYLFLLEDDRDVRDSIGELLNEWGVMVTAGATMSEVLERDEDSDRTVDALICDYRLSGSANGIDAIASLRERLGYSPQAILITGEADVEPLRARAGPETTVLHKPFTPEALAMPLLRAVRAARAIEED